MYFYEFTKKKSNFFVWLLLIVLKKVKYKIKCSCNLYNHYDFVYGNKIDPMICSNFAPSCHLSISPLLAQAFPRTSEVLLKLS